MTLNIFLHSWLPLSSEICAEESFLEAHSFLLLPWIENEIGRVIFFGFRKTFNLNVFLSTICPRSSTKMWRNGHKPPWLPERIKGKSSINDNLELKNTRHVSMVAFKMESHLALLLSEPRATAYKIKEFTHFVRKIWRLESTCEAPWNSVPANTFPLTIPKLIPPEGLLAK